MSSDSQLLEAYARNGDQTAFGEVVRTHIDLVYSAALRRAGGNHHAAAEITQDVFTSLARNAARVARHPVLNAWLHATTRNAAIDHHRREQRRLRQQKTLQSMEELHASDRDAPDWNQLSSILDPALDALQEFDRRILILRFFENRAFAEIGAILGMREDAARMRVSRALDKLRLHLGRRGIASPAAALGALISTHAVVAAPSALSATVSTAATTAAGATITGALGTLSFMNLTKLTVATAGILICAGGAVLLHKAKPDPTPDAVLSPRGLGAPVASMEAPPATDLDALVRQQNTNHVSAATMAAEEKIAVLRDILARLPDQGVPELKLATNSDWHVAVEGTLETTDDYRRALAKLRALAEGRFAKLLHPALRSYLQENDRFPSDVPQLGSFTTAPIDGTMLQRYRVAPASEIPNIRVSGEYMITQNHLIDSEFDMHIVIGRDGVGACTSLHSTAHRETEALMSAIKAHRTAHGRGFDDIAQLLPYATTPEQRAIIEKRRKENVPPGR